MRAALLLLAVVAAGVATRSHAAAPPSPPQLSPLSKKLMEAVDKGDLETVRSALEDEGIDDVINERNPQNGQTPLMYASLIGETAIAAALLDAGADPLIGERDGYTPLHGAAFQGRAETARMLLARGGIPNVRHKDGFAPIHRACWRAGPNYADTVRAFLEAGVSPTILSEPPAGADGAVPETPLDIARRTQGAEATVEVLEAAIRAAGGDVGSSSGGGGSGGAKSAKSGGGKGGKAGGKGKKKAGSSEL
jgi:ankyrin repeat protein